MDLERTLILIKPDGVQRGLIGEIVSRFERRGLRLVGMKFMPVSEALAAKHYEIHQGKPFYPGLIRFITSGPVVAMVWEGTQAIEKARTMMGVTRPTQAAPGTIRGDLAMDTGQNLVHGSDSLDTSAAEIALWFRDDELIAWQREIDTWVFEAGE